MQKDIYEQLKLLNIRDGDWAPPNTNYYTKCSITIDVPITVSSSTIINEKKETEE